MLLCKRLHVVLYGENLRMICSPPNAFWITMKTIQATLKTYIILIGFVTEADICCLYVGFNIILTFNNIPTWEIFK